MEVPACTAEMFKVRLGIPHVLPKVGVGWEHGLVSG